MSWDDSEYLDEYISFKDVSINDVLDPTPNKQIIYAEILWDTLTDYINRWNKSRKKIKVHRIERCVNTPYDSDTINKYPLWLDMGARLFSEIKKLYASKPRPKYVKVIKSMNPLDKFDTWYSATEYKLVKQKKTTDAKKK